MTVWMAGVDASSSAADERARLAQPGAAPGEVMVETCHRVEVYGAGNPPAGRLAAPGAKLLTGQAAVRHLCRVAAGLESAAVGEPEVLGQVRAAFDRARAAAPLDPTLVRLFETALSAGRRARSLESPPSSGLAATAVGWLAGRANLRSEPVLVVGRGTMGLALARSLAGAGASVAVATRNPRGAELPLGEAAARASSFAGIAVALDGPWADLTQAPPAPVADLSSPSAVPVAVRSALGESYLGIDDLFRIRSDAGRWARKAAEAVELAVAGYMTWLSSRGVAEVIEPLLERADRRRVARVEAALRRLGGLDPRQARLVDQLSRQLVADVLHEPLEAMRDDRSGEQRESARRLFKL